MSDAALPASSTALAVRHGLAWTIGWIAVSSVSTAKGYLFALRRGSEQAWWPTFGYTAAIFAVWLILTPFALRMFTRLAAWRAPALVTGAAFAGCFPVLAALHVALFALIFGPLYAPPGQGPWSLAGPVLVANLDKDAFAFAALLSIALARRRASVPIHRSGDQPVREPIATGLWARTGASLHFVSYQEIDCIRAAGDYAEIYAGARVHLAHRSLAALSAELPRGEFARIHRSTVVRVDRIDSVRPLGRGDAAVVLRDGRTLRLSRRFRRDFLARLAG